MRIIIPSCTPELVNRCLASLEGQVPWHQITVVRNGDLTDRELHYPVDSFYLSGPFNFAIVINTAIANWCRFHDYYLLLNDDCVFSGPERLQILELEAETGGYNILAASLTGRTCNQRQIWTGQGGPPIPADVVPFSCALISAKTFMKYGWLDARFGGYGSEDVDYCVRVRQGGGKIGISRSVNFDHTSTGTYSRLANFRELGAINKRAYQRKWGGTYPRNTKVVDILFLAANRAEFTRASFNSLLDHTDWDLVQRLHVAVDDNQDGVLEWLLQAIKHVPVETTWTDVSLGGPNRQLETWLAHITSAPYVCKIDNDVYLPENWLIDSLNALIDYGSSLDCVGLEPEPEHPQVEPAVEERRAVSSTRPVGGIFLARRAAMPTEFVHTNSKYMAWYQYQLDHPELRRGWIKPGLAICLLDRIPNRPWRTWGEKYEENGWQRPWDRYRPEDSWLWEDIPYEEEL